MAHSMAASPEWLKLHRLDILVLFVFLPIALIINTCHRDSKGAHSSAYDTGKPVEWRLSLFNKSPKSDVHHSVIVCLQK
jgi:hypothetical protein